MIQFGIPKREASVKKLNALELELVVVVPAPDPALVEEVTPPFAADATALGFNRLTGPPDSTG